MISIDDFKKVELRVGEIISAEKVPDSDKLLKLQVDFGKKNSISTETGQSVVEDDVRQIVSGIATYFPNPADLISKKFLFVTNLEPRTIKGFQSNGMILACGGENEPLGLFSPTSEVSNGQKAR